MNEGARRVKLLYFAWLREKIGCGAEEIDLPEGLATVADVVGWLKTRDARFDEAFARPEVIRAAVDKVHVKAAAPVAGAREIAFFPAVTGG